MSETLKFIKVHEHGPESSVLQIQTEGGPTNGGGCANHFPVGLPVADVIDRLRWMADALEARVRLHEPPSQPSAVQYDLIAHLRRQSAWSRETFGPGSRLSGVCDHIRKELREIEADPADISEWIDVTLLALDGAWRAGYTPEQIAAALEAKQTKNEGRRWPDWRTAEPGKAIEHYRTADNQPSACPPHDFAPCEEGGMLCHKCGAHEGSIHKRPADNQSSEVRPEASEIRYELPPAAPWVCQNCHEDNAAGRMTCARCAFWRDQ